MSLIQDSTALINADKLTRDSLPTIVYRGTTTIATAQEIFINGITNRRLILNPDTLIVVDKYTVAQTAAGATPSGVPEIALGNVVSFIGGAAGTFAVTQTTVNTLSDLVADNTAKQLKIEIVAGVTTETIWEVYLSFRACFSKTGEIHSSYAYSGVPS